MAKAPAVQTTSTDLAEFDASELEGLQNLGYSQKAEDGLVPILAILQENSGEAKANHPKAQAYNSQKDIRLPGNLILRSMKKLIPVNGDQPILVIPCGFVHVWGEWEGEPGEGKPTGRYPFDQRPNEAVEKKDAQNPDKTFWAMPNGRRLVDTREWYCLINFDGTWRQVMVPMAGTNHTVSRLWTELQKAKVIPGSGQKAPAWFCQYTLSTAYQTRGSQSWFTYDINEAGWVSDPKLRAMGRAMNESLNLGALAPDLEGEDEETPNKIDPEKSVV